MNCIYNFIIKGKHPFHWSDCAIYNEPAEPAGSCDCGAAKAHKKWWTYVNHLFYIRFYGWKIRLAKRSTRLFLILKKDANFRND